MEDLISSIKIGLLSGILAGIAYLLLQHYLLIANSILYILSFIGLFISGILVTMWHFFRDPERITPDNSNGIIAPADGRIIYIRKITEGTVPCAIKGKKNIEIREIMKTGVMEKTDGYIIGICMSILDVHVTRAPIDGKLVEIKSFSGRTLSPKDWRSEIENPRTTLLFENITKNIVLIEMGTPYISKILSFIKIGDIVTGGQKIGKITWGSQVDIIIPSKDVNILVKEGDAILAGKTIMANYICTTENQI